MTDTNRQLPVFTGRTQPVASPAEAKGTLDVQIHKAQMLAQMGNALPGAYRGPGGAGAMLMALDFADRHDVPIMDVVRWVSWLNGKPIIETDLAVQLANRAGIRVEVTDEGTEGTAAKARLHGPDGETSSWETYTIDEARAAGLVKDKSAWATHPRSMLRHRARKLCLQFQGPMMGATVIPADPDDIVIDAEIVEEPTPTAPQPEQEKEGPTMQALGRAMKKAKWDKGDVHAWLEQEGHDPDLSASQLANTQVGQQLLDVMVSDVEKADA